MEFSNSECSLKLFASIASCNLYQLLLVLFLHFYLSAYCIFGRIAILEVSKETLQGIHWFLLLHIDSIVSIFFIRKRFEKSLFLQFKSSFSKSISFSWKYNFDYFINASFYCYTKFSILYLGMVSSKFQ